MIIRLEKRAVYFPTTTLPLRGANSLFFSKLARIPLLGGAGVGIPPLVRGRGGSFPLFKLISVHKKEVKKVGIFAKKKYGLSANKPS